MVVNPMTPACEFGMKHCWNSQIFNATREAQNAMDQAMEDGKSVRYVDCTAT